MADRRDAPPHPDLTAIRRDLILAFARIEGQIEELEQETRARRARRLTVAALALASLGVAALGVGLAVRTPAGPPGPTPAIADRPPPPVTASPASRQAPADPRPPEPPAPAARPSEAEDRDRLRTALAEWIAATNRRDFEGQMRFYPPRLSAFYQARDVAREAVLREKRRVLAGARTVDIRAGEPEIRFEAGGAAARMRFRKPYRITGPRIHRRGEVVQELRWVKMADGWKIDSERDVQVLR